MFSSPIKKSSSSKYGRELIKQALELRRTYHIEKTDLRRCSKPNNSRCYHVDHFSTVDN